MSFIYFLFSGCEHINTEGEVIHNTKYPAKVGHEWEYNTTWKLELYDTLGHIDSTSIENIENTIVKVITESDTIGPTTI